MPPAMLQGNKASQQAISVKHSALSVKPGGHRVINLRANSQNSAQEIIWESSFGSRS
jgi:hypothetical protein